MGIWHWDLTLQTRFSRNHTFPACGSDFKETIEATTLKFEHNVQWTCFHGMEYNHEDSLDSFYEINKRS